jgi:hypothetical protein
LTAAARGTLPDGRSGRRDGTSPIEQRDGLLSSIQPRSLTMPNLLNLTHTTYSGGASRPRKQTITAARGAGQLLLRQILL